MSNRLILENEYYRVEIANPNDDGEKRFSTRYGYCGYIIQIIDKASGCALLSTPTAEWNAFSGDGFPDEFEMPIGYDEAAAGELFLKIGVGRQRKIGLVPYNNRDKHETVALTQISICKRKNSMAFYQTHSLDEYAYAYCKEIILRGKSLKISHKLENTGKKTFCTLWYSHAFLPATPRDDLQIRIPNRYILYRGDDKLFAISGDAAFRTYRFSADICGGICCNWHTSEEKTNVQSIWKNGVEIYRAEGDFSLDELQVFVNQCVISAEPKQRIELFSGDVKRWNTEYTFR